jgi:hypothetical protein
LERIGNEFFHELQFEQGSVALLICHVGAEASFPDVERNADDGRLGARENEWADMTKVAIKAVM